jgi:hypothetical protein
MLSAVEKVQEFDCLIGGVSEVSPGCRLAAHNREITMKIHAGDKVVCDTATQDLGKVRLGDNAPAFTRTIRAGDKVVRDAATQDAGKVRLGDNAPAFTR